MDGDDRVLTVGEFRRMQQEMLQRLPAIVLRTVMEFNRRQPLEERCRVPSAARSESHEIQLRPR